MNSTERDLPEDKLREIVAGCEGVTPGPWTWAIDDVSLATLGTAPFPDVGHVLSVSPCKSCIASASPKQWEWGRCTTPKLADAAHIARLDPATVSAMASELLRLRAELAEALADKARVDELLTAAVDDYDAAVKALRKIANIYNPADYRPGSQERQIGDLARAAIAGEQKL